MYQNDSAAAAKSTGNAEFSSFVRAYDWSTTALGGAAHWPQPLRTLVDVMLGSSQPMFVVWGGERTLLYNEAYAEILAGKHPSALGRDFLQVWSEIRHDLAPIVDRAYGGEPIHMDDITLVMQRKGYPEEAHFAFSYTPVRDEAGLVAGFFCACIETTSQVAAERRRQFLGDLERRLRDLSDPLAIAAAAQEALGQHLSASRVGYGEVDETERYFTTADNWTDGTVPSRHGTHDLSSFGPDIWAALKRGEKLVVRNVQNDPRTSFPEAIAAFEAIDTAAVITASLVKNGRMRAALYVHDHEPRHWSDDNAVLVEEVAERTWAAVERARAEERLRIEHDRSQQVLEGMAEGFVLLDRDFRVLDINAEGMRLESRPRAEILGKTHWDVWPGTEHSELGRLYKHAMAQRVPVSMEHRYVWPDGHHVWLDMRAYPTGDGLALFYRDITERKAADNERLRLAAAVEQSRDFIGVADLEGQAFYVNEAGRALVGIPDADAVRRTRVIDYFTSDDQETVAKVVLPAVAQQGYWEGELHFQNFATGEVIPVFYNIFPVRDAAGEVIAYGTVTRDLRDRRRAEQEVRVSEARLRTVVEQMPIGVIIARVPDGELLIYNRSSEEIMGHPMIGTTMAEYGTYGALHADGTSYAADEYPLARAVLHGETVREKEVRYRRPDGSIVHLAVSAARIVGPSGGPDLAVCTFDDISERKRHELHQRLLIDELNHRAKNLLAIVQGVAQQTLRGQGVPFEVQQAFEGRLGALAAAHNLLTRQNWEAAGVRQVIADTIDAIVTAADRVTMDGPNVLLAPKTAVSLAMAAHELATNALKYGSLSAPQGTVEVRWRIDGERLELVWCERGGPEVQVPERRGFGTRMIERALAAELGGEVRIDFQPQGVVCTVDAPMPTLAA